MKNCKNNKKKNQEKKTKGGKTKIIQHPPVSKLYGHCIVAGPNGDGRTI